MKEGLLFALICPRCGRGLRLTIFSKEGGEVKDGVLICGCAEWFPVIDFIPRVLGGDLRRIIYEDYSSFFQRYDERLPKDRISGDSEESKKMTSESFGFEWTKFPKMIKEWEKNFNWYFELVDLEDLRDKTVLEVGCGKGRHTFYAAKLAKEIFAIDLSRAIDVARYNNRESQNIHFIQADIFNMPFRPDFFDFVFSLGVLHHLPDSEGGFRRILKYLKPGGGILVYVYHKLPAGSLKFYLLRLVNSSRRITAKLPHNFLYYLCWPVALLSYGFIILPYGFLRQFKITRKIAGRFPLKLYADYPFQVILNDTFDRFSAPIENRYSEKEILGWCERAGLKDVKILGSGGWRIFGRK